MSSLPRRDAEFLALGPRLHYRFLRDGNGSRIVGSTEATPLPRASHRRLGAIDVDINVDHLAIGEVDRSGNPIDSRRFPCRTSGKDSEQARAIIGDAVQTVVAGAIVSSADDCVKTRACPYRDARLLRIR